MWQRQSYPTDKRYVVQTADSIVERCILMSTDPGDLVFDSDLWLRNRSLLCREVGSSVDYL